MGGIQTYPARDTYNFDYVMFHSSHKLTVISQKTSCSSRKWFCPNGTSDSFERCSKPGKKRPGYNGGVAWTVVQNS